MTFTSTSLNYAWNKICKYPGNEAFKSELQTIIAKQLSNRAPLLPVSGVWIEGNTQCQLDDVIRWVARCLGACGLNRSQKFITAHMDVFVYDPKGVPTFLRWLEKHSNKVIAVDGFKHCLTESGMEYLSIIKKLVESNICVMVIGCDGSIPDAYSHLCDDIMTNCFWKVNLDPPPLSQFSNTLSDYLSTFNLKPSRDDLYRQFINHHKYMFSNGLVDVHKFALWVVNYSTSDVVSQDVLIKALRTLSRDKKPVPDSMFS